MGDNLIWEDRKHFMWFPWSFTKYYIENERLMIEAGLLKTTLDETLLYRIVDVTMVQTLTGKIFGTGDLIVKTKVDSNPEIVLKNISEPKKVRSLLSELWRTADRGKMWWAENFMGNTPMRMRMWMRKTNINLKSRGRL